MPWDIKKKDGEYCVHKVGNDTPVPGGCHSSRVDAVKHMKALYANEPKSMRYNVLAFRDNLLEETDDPNIKWLKAWRYSSWEHPVYGTVEITPQTGEEFKQHFNSGTLGRQHLLNYEHGDDPAKGRKAAGEILDIDPRDDGIYYRCRFTDTALQEIRAGEWKYLSPEYDDYFINRETGEVFENVPIDLALSNIPFFKGLPPLNFSEMYTEEEPPKTFVEVDKPKGGNQVDELLKKFADKLGIALDDDADEASVLASAERLNETIEPLRRAKNDGEATRTFREAFPDQYERMMRMEAQAIDTDARAFADSYSRFTIKHPNTGDEYKAVIGFSEVVKDKIADVHKRFSERTVTQRDLKELLDMIGDKGIVDYSEHGSSRLDTSKNREFSENPRRAFAEAVEDIITSDNVDYEQAVHLAANKWPKLYEDYCRDLPQR